MPRGETRKKPVRTAFRPKKVMLELTTKHTHRIFSIHKPMLKYTDLGHNPNRILLGSIQRSWLKAFYYQDNPQKVFLAIGEEVIGLNEDEFRNLFRIVNKMGWILGFFGKVTKKIRIKFRNAGNRNLYSRE